MSIAMAPITIEPPKDINSIDTTHKHLESPSHRKEIEGEPSHPSLPRNTNRQTISRMKDSLKRPFQKTAQQFPLFNQLPVEIREQIWEACIAPRVHELHPCSNLYRNRMTFRSNSSSTPAIFHTSHESRRIALKHYKLMVYSPSSPPRDPENDEDPTTLGKGILRFYYAPKVDTLFLNSLMGLFVMFMLLEEPLLERQGGESSTEARQMEGVLAGWERVAFDAERAQLTILLAGAMGHSPQPRFKKLMPDLKELIVAFDYTKSGKTRFRTSVWPGENGTTLRDLGHKRSFMEWKGLLDGCMIPLGQFLRDDYLQTQAIEMRDARDKVERGLSEGVPTLSISDVERKKYIRGDLRYAFRWSCSVLRIRPRGVFRRL